MSISRTTHCERVGGLLRVGDHRRDQVRDALVPGELHPLRVDQHHPHVIRRGPQVSTDRISELMQLDLPAPVAPATSRWGILVRLASDHAALDVLAERDQHRMVDRAGPPPERSTSPSMTISGSVLGISTPTALLPGIGLMIRTSGLLTA